MACLTGIVQFRVWKAGLALPQTAATAATGTDTDKICWALLVAALVKNTAVWLYSSTVLTQASLLIWRERSYSPPAHHNYAALTLALHPPPVVFVCFACARPLCQWSTWLLNRNEPHS